MTEPKSTSTEQRLIKAAFYSQVGGSLVVDLNTAIEIVDEENATLREQLADTDLAFTNANEVIEKLYADLDKIALALVTSERIRICQQCAEGVPLEDGYHVKSTVGPNYRIDSKTLCLAHLKIEYYQKEK